MSKKNSKPLKAKQHAFDILREKRDAAETKKRQDKREAKVAKSGEAPKVKRKPMRLRKNSVIRGIKIQDSDSKKKVKKILKKERAERAMEVDAAKPGLKRTMKKVKRKAAVTKIPEAIADAMVADAMEL